ncbi:unnamed protein product [Ectocarpus sp. 12 AP-2014]
MNPLKPPQTLRENNNTSFRRHLRGVVRVEWGTKTEKRLYCSTAGGGKGLSGAFSNNGVPERLGDTP